MCLFTISIGVKYLQRILTLYEHRSDSMEKSRKCLQMKILVKVHRTYYMGIYYIFTHELYSRWNKQLKKKHAKKRKEQKENIFLLSVWIFFIRYVFSSWIDFSADTRWKKKINWIIVIWKCTYYTYLIINKQVG